jgi:hypothetical protein
VNTKNGIKDLDTTDPIQKFKWVHMTMIYTGTSMQIYLNGELNVFSAQTGAINTSTTDLSIGKRRPKDDQYYIKGRIDEVKIFDVAISPSQVKKLPNEWSEVDVLGTNDLKSEVRLFPNPTSRFLYLESAASIDAIKLLDMAGKQVNIKTRQLENQQYEIDLAPYSDGLYTLQIREGNINRTFRVIVKK